jgi:hypothetical protein
MNKPFKGSVWNVKGNIISAYPNHRQRRAQLNVLPNSTKVGAGDANPIRSMKQLKSKL